MDKALQELLDRCGKRCPKCGSGQITSNNTEPLQHRCLDCHATFSDKEAVTNLRS